MAQAGDPPEEDELLNAFDAEQWEADAAEEERLAEEGHPPPAEKPSNIGMNPPPEPGSHAEEIELCKEGMGFGKNMNVDIRDVQNVEAWITDNLILPISDEWIEKYEPWHKQEIARINKEFKDRPGQRQLELEKHQEIYDNRVESVTGRMMDEYRPLMEAIITTADGGRPTAEMEERVKRVLNYAATVECESISSQPYVSAPINDGTDKGKGR